MTVTAFINDETSLWQQCSTAWCRHQLFHWKEWLLQELDSNCLNACLSETELRQLRLCVIHLHVNNLGCRQWRRKRGARWCVTFLHQSLYTGLFISPSGISDPCGTIAGMVTPKGSMSTEAETLQVSVLPYRCSICAPLVTSEGAWQTFLAHARQSRPMASAGLFISQRTGSHSAGISCTTHELFCP